MRSLGGNSINGSCMTLGLTNKKASAVFVCGPWQKHMHVVPMRQEGGPALVWIGLKLLMIVLPFCILLRIVAVVREVHLQHSQGSAAEQSVGAVLWVRTHAHDSLLHDCLP
jgi:hypothetical protein